MPEPFYPEVTEAQEPTTEMVSGKDFFAKLPQKFFDAHYRARQKQNKESELAYKVYTFQNVGDDGSMASRNPVKDGLTFSVINTLADNCVSMITPDMQYVTAKLRRPNPLVNIEAIQEMAWQLVNDELDFPTRLWSIVRDAGISNGVMARIFYNKRYDFMEDITKGYPDFQLFGFDDFTFDSYAPTFREANKCMRWRVCAQDLRSDQNYDQAEVAKIIKEKVDGTSNNYNSVYRSQEEKLNDEYYGGDSTRYEVYEFIGNVTDPQGEYHENQIITTCNNRLLRMSDNPTPRGMDPCVYFSLPPESGSIMGMCLGAIVAPHDIRISKLESYIDFSTCLQAAPPMYGIEELLEDYDDVITLDPFAMIPIKSNLGPAQNQIGLLPLVANSGPANTEIANLRNRVELMGGITTPQMGGQPSGNPSATELNIIQTGANIRLGTYVRFIQRSCTELVQKLVVVMIEEIIREGKVQSILMPNGEIAQITPEMLQQAVLDVKIDGVTESRLSNAKTQTFLSGIQFVLADPELRAKVDMDKVFDRYFANTAGGTSFGESIKKDPEQLMMEQQQAQAMQQAQMGGQPPPVAPPQPTGPQPTEATELETMNARQNV